MKRLFIILALLLLPFTASAQTVTASATLKWTAVTTSTTGGPLGGPTSYNIYDSNVAAGGTCTTAGMKEAATGLTALTDTLSLPGLTPGTIECFAVTAEAGGVTSAYSNIGSVTVPTAPPAVPGATTVTVTVVFVSSP